MESIKSYMTRHGFGDYSHADQETRERMEAGALAYAAHEQTRKSIFSELGERRARERFAADTATAADLMTLQDIGAITEAQVSDYYARHKWTPRKYGRR